MPKNSCAYTAGFWYSTAGSFMCWSRAFYSVLNCLPPISLLRLSDRSSEQHATSCLLIPAALRPESSLYWVHLNTKLFQCSLVSSTPNVGLGNLSGFLLCVVGVTTGAGCTSLQVCHNCCLGIDLLICVNRQSLNRTGTSSRFWPSSPPFGWFSPKQLLSSLYVR